MTTETEAEAEQHTTPNNLNQIDNSSCTEKLSDTLSSLTEDERKIIKSALAVFLQKAQNC